MAPIAVQARSSRTNTQAISQATSSPTILVISALRTKTKTPRTQSAFLLQHQTALRESNIFTHLYKPLDANDLNPKLTNLN